MKHITIAKTFPVAVLAALALSVGPAARAADKGCSNASLQGTFADKDTGFIYPAANAAPMPFAGVNVETFDGNGNITGTGFASVGGSGGPQTYTGTYKVNPDCTGTYSVTINPGSVPAHAFFVIDDSLNELQIVITDPGTVITCIARRQFPISDSRN
jgi:hypothetical protein